PAFLLVVRDVDGDGVWDAAVLDADGLRVMAGQGDGSFAPVRTLPAPSRTWRSWTSTRTDTTTGCWLAARPATSSSTKAAPPARPPRCWTPSPGARGRTSF